MFKGAIELKKSRLISLVLVGMLAASSISSLSAYVYDMNGNLVYVPDSAVTTNSGYFYYNGQLYYVGSSPPSTTTYTYGSTYPYYGYYGYYGNYGYYGYYGSTYYSSTTQQESLGGVTIPTSTLVEAQANGKPLNLSMAGMTQNRADSSYAPVLGLTAERLSFRQALGRAEDNTLCLTLDLDVSTTTDANQYAFGILGKISGFESAMDQSIESISFVDRNDRVRVTMNTAAIVSAAKGAFTAKDGDLRTDKLYIEVCPVTDKPDFSNTLNSSFYSVRAFMCQDSKRTDISAYFKNVHLIVKCDRNAVSLLIGGTGDDYEAADSCKNFQNTSTGYFASGYLPIGSNFVVVEK